MHSKVNHLMAFSNVIKILQFCEVLLKSIDFCLMMSIPHQTQVLQLLLIIKI